MSLEYFLSLTNASQDVEIIYYDNGNQSIKGTKVVLSMFEENKDVWQKIKNQRVWYFYPSYDNRLVIFITKGE